VGDFIGISMQSMSRIVLGVSQAIASMRKDFITTPAEKEELSKSFESFYSIAGFPQVFGAIDCTHIKIIGEYNFPYDTALIQHLSSSRFD